MNSTAIGAMAFAFIAGAGVLGLRVRAALPHHHQSADTKEAVRILMGVVATMAALVLGLLVASTKGAYDNQKSQITQLSAKIVFLDRVLAIYGAETAETRVLLKRSAEDMVTHTWSSQPSRPAELAPSAASGAELYASIERLAPQNEMQRTLKSQAIQLATDLGQARWLLFEESGTSISLPFLIIVLAWFAIIFVSVGLFAPTNSAVIVAMILAALSASSAIFLILELDMPFDGLIQISSEPMRNALRHLGQ